MAKWVYICHTEKTSDCVGKTHDWIAHRDEWCFFAPPLLTVLTGLLFRWNFMPLSANICSCFIEPFRYVSVSDKKVITSSTVSCVSISIWSPPVKSSFNTFLKLFGEHLNSLTVLNTNRNVSQVWTEINPDFWCQIQKNAPRRSNTVECVEWRGIWANKVCESRTSAGKSTTAPLTNLKLCWMVHVWLQCQ